MKLIIAFIVASTFAVSAFAQATPPQPRIVTTMPSGTVPALVNTTSASSVVQELPMIVSRAILREYAIGQATSMNAGIGAQGIVSTGYAYKDWTGKKTSDEMVAMAKTITVSADTVDTSQTVWVYCSVNNSDGDVLFSGSTSNQPVLEASTGKYVLPNTAGNIVFGFEQASIKLGQDISFAAIVVKDENGNLNWYPIYSYGQKIFFPPQSAGLQNAYVQVGFTDGTGIAYSISSGKRLAQTTLSATLNPTFANVVHLKNPTAINLTVTSSNGVGVVPTIEVLNSAAAGYSVNFAVVTSDGKRPVRVWTKSQTGTVWTSQTLPTTSIGTVVIPPGVTYFVPEWLPADFKENIVPVSNGGGKG